MAILKVWNVATEHFYVKYRAKLAAEKGRNWTAMSNGKRRCQYFKRRGYFKESEKQLSLIIRESSRSSEDFALSKTVKK